VHRDRRLTAIAAERPAWLMPVRTPVHAPEPDPVESVWSLLKRSITDFVAVDPHGLVRVVRRTPKKIRFRPDPLDGRLAETGLVIEHPIPTRSTRLPEPPAFEDQHPHVKPSRWLIQMVRVAGSLPHGERSAWERVAAPVPRVPGLTWTDGVVDGDA
jgi:hypothetical protein